MSLKDKILFILFFLLILGFYGGLHLKGKESAHNNNGHIIAQLTCQAPLREANKDIYMDQSIPFYKDYFYPGEEVWVKLCPKTVGHDHLYKKSRLYVVPFNKGILRRTGNNLSLKDVTGDGIETIFIQPECDRGNYIKIWSKPGCLGKKYIVVVDFFPFGIYNKGQDILDIELDLKSTWVCLESISFNHDPTDNCRDSINIRMNKDREVHVPEWKRGGYAYPAAYIRNKSITIKAVFSASQDVKNAEIYASEVCGKLGDIMPETVVFKNGKSNEVEFHLSTKTPNEIRSFYQGWIWSCKAINGQDIPDQIPVRYSENKIFTVLDEPQGPWSRTGQSKTWADVLEYSCLWADGKTTPEDAAERITQNLYNDLGCVYASCSRYTGSKNESFNLTKFMNSIPNIQYVNCYDMGKALVTFSNILGCGLCYNLSTPFGTLKCIRPIGSSRDCCKNFSDHGFGSLCDKIFDSSLKVDTCIYPAQWLTNLLWSDYKNMVIKKGSPGSPQPFTFNIDSICDKQQGISEAKLGFVKEKYQFSKWLGKTGKIIPGVTISPETVKELKDMRKMWKKDTYSLETIQNETYLKISQWWQLMDKQLLATMVVGRTFEAAKQYLILHYANTNQNPPLIKRTGTKFGMCIGNVCFVTPTARGGSFSTIDFIRRNVIIMLEAEGSLTVELQKIANGLDCKLKNNETKKCYEKLSAIPRITEFSCQSTRIKLGDAIQLKLEVQKSGYSELHHYWKMTGGGIEKDSSGNLMYYGGEPGKHTIVVTTMNELGLYDKSKSLEITVVDE